MQRESSFILLPRNGGSMSEHNERDSAADTEQTEMVGRREAVKRFAKYTAPVMLAVLMSTTDGKAICANSGCNP
jgi:hypothetical protein